MGLCCSTWTKEKASSVKNVIYDDFKIPPLHGKVVAITGCTTGTGYYTALAAAKNGATVIMLNRSSDRQEVAMTKLQSEVPSGTFDFISCDLSSYKSVRAACDALQTKYGESGIDVMCCNAGVMALEDVATEDGFDIQMQTNQLSHVMMIHACWSMLEKAAAARGESRVVMHSSMARHAPAGKPEAKYFGPNGGNLGGNGASMLFGGARWVRYGQTKFANFMFTQALHHRLAAKDSKIKSVCAAPGLAATNLQVTTRERGGMSETWIMGLAQSAGDGACPLMLASFGADVKSGDFYEPKGTVGEPVKKDLLPRELNKEAQDLVWDLSEKACDIKWDL